MPNMLDPDWVALRCYLHKDDAAKFKAAVVDAPSAMNVSYALRMYIITCTLGGDKRLLERMSSIGADLDYERSHHTQKKIGD